MPFNLLSKIDFHSLFPCTTLSNRSMFIKCSECEIGWKMLPFKTILQFKKKKTNIIYSVKNYSSELFSCDKILK